MLGVGRYSNPPPSDGDGAIKRSVQYMRAWDDPGKHDHACHLCQAWNTCHVLQLLEKDQNTVAEVVDDDCHFLYIQISWFVDLWRCMSAYFHEKLWELVAVSALFLVVVEETQMLAVVYAKNSVEWIEYIWVYFWGTKLTITNFAHKIGVRLMRWCLVEESTDLFLSPTIFTPGYLIVITCMENANIIEKC